MSPDPRTFPAAAWTPQRDEYFEALAPEGGHYEGAHPGWGMLHGSGSLKLAERSLRAFGEVMAAKLARQAVLRSWAADRGCGPPGLEAALTPRAVAVLESQESKPWMRFGSAVESLVMPGDPMPELTAAEKVRAEIRAQQILEHPDAGKYLRAKGAAYQVAHRWQDEASGLWFRLRFDLCYWMAGPRPAVQDLKVWSGVTERNLPFKIRDNGADIQAAIYRRGALDLWRVAPPHTLIVVGPHILDPIFVRTLSDATIADADARVSLTAQRLAGCYRSGQFIDEAERPQEV